MNPDYTIKLHGRTYGVWLLRFGAVIVRQLSAHYSLQD